MVVGTRPEIIKMTPIIREMRRRDLDFQLLHTGQHYDWELSERHIPELDLPRPKAILPFVPREPLSRLATTIRVLARTFRDTGTGMVVAVGDTDSTLGAAIAASRMGLPMAHIEAGCRSFDPAMPEERNRVTISACSRVHFAPTKTATLNLLREGIRPASIFQYGHPIVSLVSSLSESIAEANAAQSLGLEPSRYVLATVHREENVEDPAKLSSIFSALAKLDLPVVFPIHPRTRRAARRLGLFNTTGAVRLIPPVSYLAALSLIKDAAFIVTDSGGLQQEAYLLATPCLTLRRNTEWPETVEARANFLVGSCTETIIQMAHGVVDARDEISRKCRASPHIMGRPDSAMRIVAGIIEWNDQPCQLADQMRLGYPKMRLVRMDADTYERVRPFCHLCFTRQGLPSTEAPESYRALVHGPGILIESIKSGRSRTSYRSGVG